MSAQSIEELDKANFIYIQKIKRNKFLTTETHICGGEATVVELSIKFRR